MSRHRNIRSMDFSDDYAGYDDVYGHSVEDDYCVSPSDAAFIYDREGSRGQQKISAFFKTDEDIAEEDETDADKDRIDSVKAKSCIERVKEVVGVTKLSDSELMALILKFNYNVERVIDAVLKTASGQTESRKPTDNRDETDVELISTQLNTPNAQTKSNSLSDLTEYHLKNSSRKFTVPKLFQKTEISQENPSDTDKVPKLFPKKDLSNCNQEEMNNSSKVMLCNSENSANHNSLQSLASSHLNKEGKFQILSCPSEKFTSEQNFKPLDSSTSNLRKTSKFTIPKLFPKKSVSESDETDSLNRNFYTPISSLTDETFSSLAELTKNHLKINSVSKISNTDVTRNSVSSDSSALDENFDLICSSSAPSSTCDKIDSDEDDSNWQIDLSHALINSKNVSLSQKPQVTDVEEFFPQYIDCDMPTRQDKEVKPCQIDLTPVLYRSLDLEGNVSSFGKVVTRKSITRQVPYRVKLIKLGYVVFSDEIFRNSIDRFKFNTPSPDDQILTYLRRK